MPQIRNPVAPNLPLASQAYERRQVEETNRALRVYFNQLDNAMQQLLLGFNHYGTFQDRTTETNPVANTENLVSFTDTVEAFGVEIDALNPSRLVVSRSGVYNFQFSAQLAHAAGTKVAFYIWFKINGTNIPWSATRVTVESGTADTAAAWNYLASMQAGDYFELAWSSPDTTATILAAAAAAPVPAIPAVIMTVNYLFPNSTGA